jgi:hypothetical protein
MLMKIDVAAVRKTLKSFDFKTLFYEHLGWDKHQAHLDITVDGNAVSLTANRLVAEMASAVVVAHAAPGSKMEALCRDILAAGKPLYTFDHPANAELMRAGACQISAMDVATFRSVPRHGHSTNEGLPRDLRA